MGLTGTCICISGKNRNKIGPRDLNATWPRICGPQWEQETYVSIKLRTSLRIQFIGKAFGFRDLNAPCGCTYCQLSTSKLFGKGLPNPLKF